MKTQSLQEVTALFFFIRTFNKSELLTLFGLNAVKLHLININLEEISDTNRDAFCRRASLAVVVIGCAIMLSGIGNIFFPSPLLAVGYTAVFAAGMLIFVSAMRKYGSTEETKKR